mmetsp:Transcript_114315/g.318221  ORF Transcript_114315/g.318221 Transcript_114315/m.318221 type:complete len:268 (-) Transcript_114315:295-1098(-)
MALSAQELLEAAGDRERPIFLRSQRRLPPPRDDPDARILAATLALAGSEGDAANHKKVPRKATRARGRSIRQQGVAGTRDGAIASSPAALRPDSPTSHIRKMYTIMRQPIEVKPCDEYHRLSWLPLEIPAQHVPLQEEAQKALKRFGTKQHVWGNRPTDYRTSNWYVENQWSLRALRRSESDPAVGGGVGERQHGSQAVKQPWTKSAGVTSCMVGGNGGGLKGRNIGLYEDSFKLWPDYQVPQHGLCSSDVTRMAEGAAMMKAMMRK